MLYRLLALAERGFDADVAREQGRMAERADTVALLRVWAPSQCTAGGKALAKLHGQLGAAIERGAHVAAAQRERESQRAPAPGREP